MSFWDRIDRLVNQAGGALAFAGAAAIVLMMLHICVDVTGRYFFNHPLPGTLETVTYYYMVMVTALPFAYVTRSQGQIVVEMFTNWLPRRWLDLLEAVVGILVLVYVGVFAWKTGQEAVVKTVLGEVRNIGSTQILVWPTRWFPPLGFGVMGCAVLLRAVAHFGRFLRQ